MASLRFGCRVDGLSISGKQVDFANGRAEQMGLGGKVSFHLRNMLDNGFADGTFQAIWNNESTMYVDLHDAVRRARAARWRPAAGTSPSPAATTTCTGAAVAGGRPDQRALHLRHPPAQRATSRRWRPTAWCPISVVDLTAATIPYWELRQQSSVATGIEEAFLTAYKEGSFQYLLIAADKV